ncbi:hypothetical protein HK097_007622 [Rhizophlyctis rosea]|uniref:Uncharacterized protein n=1 Tax=Rhizophlyctis rosea TaxID=64517 RepID=A0AAD5X543_9FUNG|nr:hypothetical protein HK097_007622 [Rhizophlyctis rosea]
MKPLFDQDARRFQYITRMDLSGLTSLLRDQTGLPADTVAKTVAAYRDFLKLKVYHRDLNAKLFSPSLSST